MKEFKKIFPLAVAMTAILVAFIPHAIVRENDKLKKQVEEYEALFKVPDDILSKYPNTISNFCWGMFAYRKHLSDQDKSNAAITCSFVLNRFCVDHICSEIGK